MGYQTPADAPITDDWQEHKDRDSSEPGTDFACVYGTPIRAVSNGVITYVKTSNSSATGRVVEYSLDDGRGTRSLHLSATWVNVGQHVLEGQFIGASGASGYGSDWYYGPHEHHTLWPGSAWDDPTIDFENYVGSDDGQSFSEEDMLIIVALSASSDGVIRNGWVLADNLVGPITLISQSEMDALEYWKNKGVPYRRAEWDGDTIRGVVSVRGMYSLATNEGRSDYSKVTY